MFDQETDYTPAVLYPDSFPSFVRERFMEFG